MPPDVIDLTLQDSPAASEDAPLPPLGATNVQRPHQRSLPTMISSDPFTSSPVKHTNPRAMVEQANVRDVLDVFPTSPLASQGAGSALANKSAAKNAAAWDPISSSIPQSSPQHTTRNPQRSRQPRGESIINIDSSDTADTASEAEELPDIASFDLTRPRPYINNLQTKFRSANGPPGPRPKLQKTASTVSSDGSRDKRAQERRDTAAAKTAEREKKRKEREDAKEAKKFEKQRAAAIAEVNKARADRKVSATEMIVDLSPSLDAKFRDQIVLLLESLDIHYTVCDQDNLGVIKWRRKINSRFDEESGQWVPAPHRIDLQHHTLKVLSAESLVDLATKGLMDQQVLDIKAAYPPNQVIYILEGVMSWTRKNRNIRNRQFAADVRQRDGAPLSSNSRSRHEYIPGDVIEDAMLRLQIEHGILIHHTAVPTETAQWVATFTQHISTIPYKKQRDDSTSAARFCMDNGQVKTGEDAQDTYVKMLQEIFRITAPIAYGIASEFPTVSELVKGLEKGGPGRLDAVRKSANREGVSSDRNIGQAISKRMHKIFTGRDPMSTDI